MTYGQQRQYTRLINLGYRPMIGQPNTDGSVRVSIARKLDTGRLELSITTDGNLRPHHRNRTPTTIRSNQQ